MYGELHMDKRDAPSPQVPQAVHRDSLAPMSKCEFIEKQR